MSKKGICSIKPYHAIPPEKIVFNKWGEIIQRTEETMVLTFESTFHVMGIAVPG